MSDFSLVNSDPATTNDFALVGPGTSPDDSSPRPIAASVLSAASSPDTHVDTMGSLQSANIDAAQQLINNRQDFGVRLQVAQKAQERTMAQLNKLKSPGSPIDPQTRQTLDNGYQAIAAQNIADNARTSAETEAVRRIQNYQSSGETVEAKLAFQNFENGTAEDVYRRQAEKNLILEQYAEKMQAEGQKGGFLDGLYRFMDAAIPFNYNFAASGVDPGSSTSLKNFFMTGTSLQQQGENIWNRYRDPKDLQAALDGGELDRSIRSNATTWGWFDPTSAADLAHSINGQNESDRSAANAWGVSGLVEAVPGVGSIDMVPWRSFGSLPNILTRAGSRSSARKVIADSWQGIVEDGEKIVAARTGMTEQSVADNLVPSAINPAASTPNAVPHGVDVATHLEAAKNILADLPKNIQVTRATTPEEIQNAYEGALKAEEARIGKPIKDYRFMTEDVRTGQVTEHVPGVLPEQGNVVHYVEYTVGKKGGGGFASARTAAADASKRGLGGSDIVYDAVENSYKRVDPEFSLTGYHGTASMFDKHSDAELGKITEAKSAREAHFFTNNPDVAWTYAVEAAKDKAITLPEFQEAAARFKKASANRIENPDEYRAAQEAYHSVKSNTSVSGQNIRPSKIRLRNPYVHDLADQFSNGYDEQAYSTIIARAKADGHDGVIFKNTDDTMGAHPDIENAFSDDARMSAFKNHDVYAVFDPENVKAPWDANEIVRDVSGQWFIKGRVNVKEEGFYTTPLNTPNNGAFSALRSDARRLDRSAQQKAVAAGQNAEKVFATLNHQIKNTLKGVDRDSKRWLDEIIRKGQNQAKWLNDREFNSLFERAAGHLPSERVVEAYHSYRLYNDAEYLLRNDNLYKELVVSGHETARFNVLGDSFFDGTARVKAEGSMPRERYYNVSDHQHVTNLDSERWDRLMADGYLHVETREAFTMPDGTKIRNFVMKRSDIERSPLERMQLAYSEGGHRAYTGKYFAKQAAEGVQPDTGQKFLLNPNVFRTADNPNRLRAWAHVMNEALADARNGIRDVQHFEDNVFGAADGTLSFPSGQEFVDAVEKGSIDLHNPIEVVGDREMPSAYHGIDERTGRMFESESAASGYYRTTGRLYSSKKGEHLLDESGDFAETVDPWETMNSALFNVSRMSSLSNYKTSTLERFGKTYGRFLAVRDLENVGPTALITAPLKDGLPQVLARRIKAEQAGISRILHFETGWEKGVRHAQREFSEWVLGGAEGGAREALFKGANWLVDSNPVRWLRSLAFDAKLGFFNIGQLLLQSSTIIATKSIAGADGSGAIRSMVPLMSYQLSKGNEAILDVLAKRSWKMAGFGSEQEMKEFARFVNRTGFMNVGNTHLLINDFGPNRVFGAASALDGIREKGRTFFYQAEQMNRAVASRVAWNRLTKEGLEPGSAAFRERFIGMADDLTFNMTNESSAAFQHGVFSIPTQFWAYNVRMMDAMFGNGFTSAQKARLIAGQLLFAGAGGVPVAASLADYFKRKNGESPDVDSLMGTLDRGLVDRAISELFGADVRFGSRVGTGDWLNDTIKDLFGMGDYGEKSPAETFGGATFSISTQAGQTLGSVMRYAMAESGGGDWQLTKDSLVKLADNISSFSYAHKAYLVDKYGMYKSARGTVQGSDLPSADTFFVALGLQPEQFESMGYMQDYLKDQQSIVSEASAQVRNWRQESFNNPDKMEENEKKVNALMQLYDPSVRTQILKQTNKITDKSFYDHVAEQYRNERMKETPNG